METLRQKLKSFHPKISVDGRLNLKIQKTIVKRFHCLPCSAPSRKVRFWTSPSKSSLRMELNYRIHSTSRSLLNLKKLVSLEESISNSKLRATSKRVCLVLQMIRRWHSSQVASYCSLALSLSSVDANNSVHATHCHNLRSFNFFGIVSQEWTW